MTVYWLACLLSSCITWLVMHIKHNEKKYDVLYWSLITFLAAFPLIFISAIRYNVGADYIPYYRYYIGILNGANQGRYEILYYYVNKIVAFFHGSVSLLFGVSASLFLIPVYRRIMKDSPYPSMSIFLLLGMTYYFFFLNGTRQMIGAAFLLLAIPFAEKRKIFPFVLLTLIATGFHTTCIVFLAFYFIAYIDFGVKTLIALTLVVFVCGQAIGNVVNNILSGMNYYSVYLQSDYAARGQGYIVLAMNILLVIFATIFYQKNNSKFKMYYNLQIITLWSAALTGKIVLVDRYRMAFGLGSIILVPMILHGIKNRKIRWSCSALILSLYFIYVMYTVGIQNSNLVLPYQTIFSAKGLI